MSKTIEEAAREATQKGYCCETCVHKQDCDICGGQNTAFDCCECPADSYEEGFKAGAQHVLSLPLSERLTEEEKDDMKAEYDEAKIFCENCDPRGVNFAANEVKMLLLERIFGKEMFEKEEE